MEKSFWEDEERRLKRTLFSERYGQGDYENKIRELQSRPRGDNDRTEEIIIQIAEKNNLWELI